MQKNCRFGRQQSAVMMRPQEAQCTMLVASPHLLNFDIISHISMYTHSPFHVPWPCYSNDTLKSLIFLCTCKVARPSSNESQCHRLAKEHSGDLPKPSGQILLTHMLVRECGPLCVCCNLLKAAMNQWNTPHRPGHKRPMKTNVVIPQKHVTLSHLL